jgi:hypothetical protein
LLVGGFQVVALFSSPAALEAMSTVLGKPVTEIEVKMYKTQVVRVAPEGGGACTQHGLCLISSLSICELCRMHTCV